MRKIPRRYSGFVIGALMGILMGLVVSFLVTLSNLGMTEGFLQKWMVAFFGSLPVQWPLGVVLTPAVKALVDRFTEQGGAT